MIVLEFLFFVILFTFHLLIPFDFHMFNSLRIVIPYKFLIMIYLMGIIFFVYSICLLIKNNKFNYDILFLILLFWILNLIGYVYFNIFNNIIISFITTFSCFLNLIFLKKHLKKINKSFLLSILMFFYIYLLIILFKFI